MKSRKNIPGGGNITAKVLRHERIWGVGETEGKCMERVEEGYKRGRAGGDIIR